MKLTTEIKISTNQVLFLLRALNNANAEFSRDEIVWEGQSRFSDGTQAVFQVCAANDPEQYPCWSQIVLFDENGQEIACSDVSENLLGPCEFFYIDGTSYTVNIVEADI